MWSKLKFFWILPQSDPAMNRIVARNRGARNVVKKCQLPRAPLLFGEQSRIFHGNRYLPSCRHHHVEITLFEDVFPHLAHCDHYSGRLALSRMARRRDTGGLLRRNVMPNRARVFSKSERISKAARFGSHIRERIIQFAFSLGQNEIILYSARSRFHPLTGKQYRNWLLFENLSSSAWMVRRTSS